MMRLLCFLLATAIGCSGAYKLGVGIADLTGPIGVTLMGYGALNQQGIGIHLRQWSRAYIIDDGNQRIVFVSIDLGMMGDGVRMKVIKELEEKYKGLYNMDNVILSATHTHSAPGGFLFHTMFDFPSFGFSKQSFDAIVSGIVESVIMAHENMQEGKLFLSRGVLEGVTINRSPAGYANNPKEERDRYKHNVDKEMVQLKFVSSKGTPLGAITWYAIHAVSMNNTNLYISSDNLGYASILFEEKMNPGRGVGKGPFVAAFASSNEGDVTPNTSGPKCHPSGEECDEFYRCTHLLDSCYATGPGSTPTESTKIIGQKLFQKGSELWKDWGVEITGPVKGMHQYVHMPSAETEIFNKTTGKHEKVTGCTPAMGYSAGAGTTDGPFLFFLHQGMKESIDWLDNIIQIVFKPTAEDKVCHYPKPILLATGRMDFPFEWQPHIVSTQIGLLGDLTIACVPGEFTTMSGRRMRNAIASVRGTDPNKVIIAGLCNTYGDYITTFEEYQVQRYEAGSTLFGPHTLSIYLSQYKKLVAAAMRGLKLERGPEPKGLDPDKMVSLIPPVGVDGSGDREFGDVIQQPQKEVAIGQTVTAKFVAGNPRNDLLHRGSYLTVEHQVNNEWKTVATDANWETRFTWRLTSIFLWTSEAEIEWTVPATAATGTYRFKHFGSHKTNEGAVLPYEGTSDVFRVVKRAGDFSFFKNRFIRV